MKLASPMAQADCIWGGSRVWAETSEPQEAFALTRACGISVRLTYGNSLLWEEHPSNAGGNALFRLFEKNGWPQHGVIAHSELLFSHIRQVYPGLYLVALTTEGLTGFGALSGGCAAKPPGMGCRSCA